MPSIGPEPADARASTPAGSAPRTPLLLRHLLTLSIYWLGVTTIWAGLNSIVIPSRLDEIDPERVGLLLAIINAVGVIAPIIVQPTVGMISDYTTTRWGRRKPYIVIGTVLDVVFLIGLATSQTYLSLVALYLLLQVSSNIAQGPFQGYVPDLVPAEQVGRASGYMGVMIVLGQIVGTAVATLGVAIGSLFIGTVALGVIEALTMVVLVLTIDEGPAPPPRRQSILRIALSAWGTDLLRHGNIFWLLAVRALFLGAVAAPVNLSLLYFRRAHGMPLVDATQMVLAGTVIIGVTTALAAIPGARLSDRYGRRPLIWAASAIGAVGLAGVAVAPNEWLAIALFVPFGIATGTFLSVDWALMTDAIPKATAGRFMGILNAGTAVAAPAFLAVAGPTLDGVGAALGEPYGPRAAMLMGVIFLLGSALALLKVDARRRES
jgi:MFS family permease